jgi:HPt (histidine-containing phosphotransfer) domain-containing protein
VDGVPLSAGSPAEASRPGPADLDESIIEGLHALGGADLVDEIVSLACQDIYRCLALLDQALVADDAPAAGKLAHTISGVCANIGAIGVVDTARAMERLAATGNLSTAASLQAELGLRWRRAHDALDAKTVRSKAV